MLAAFRHKDERRIEAHIFLAFFAYALQVTLTRRLHALAPGLTARSALDKFAVVQIADSTKPATRSDRKPATCTDLKPAGIPV